MLRAVSAKSKEAVRGAAMQTQLPNVRHDKVNENGTVALRYRGRLHHIGVGRPYASWRAVLLVAGTDVRMLGTDGSPLRHLTLDSAPRIRRCRY